MSKRVREQEANHEHDVEAGAIAHLPRNVTFRESEITLASTETTKAGWETVTVQVSLVAAIIAGSVGLASAILSTLIAALTIRRANKQDFETRTQQIALALLPRRLDALEQIWGELFQIEKNGGVRPASIDELIPVTLWLSRPLRDRFVALLLNDVVSPDDIRELRNELSEASAVTTIDSSISSISRRSQR